MRYELKRCPFCGAPARLEMASRAFVNGESCKATYVRCLGCNARTGKFRLPDAEDKFGRLNTRLKVVELWNRRVNAEI